MVKLKEGGKKKNATHQVLQEVVKIIHIDWQTWAEPEPTSWKANSWRT